MAQFPDSIFTQEAMTEMRLLRPAPGASSLAHPAAEPCGLLGPPASSTPLPSPSATPISASRRGRQAGFRPL